MSNDDALRFPIGKFAAKDSYTAAEVQQNISVIEQLPKKIEDLVKDFGEKQLNTVYREGGWTARQVLHHLSDSHMNAYVRFKWTLTEDTPVIKAYDEKAWATTPEVNADPSLSIAVLKPLHAKWVVLMRGLSTSDLQKQFIHPDGNKHIRLERMVALYAWHSEHHLGHLKIIAAK
jgi:hypothetical protein